MKILKNQKTRKHLRAGITFFALLFLPPALMATRAPIDTPKNVFINAGIVCGEETYKNQHFAIAQLSQKIQENKELDLEGVTKSLLPRVKLTNKKTVKKSQILSYSEPNIIKTSQDGFERACLTITYSESN